MSDVSSSVPIRVLVLGHSFVHRLQEFLKQSSQWQSNLNLAAAGHNVYFFGRGGLQFPRLLQLLSQACAPIYDLVVLEFGTNDLASGCPVELLVDRAIAVAQTLLEKYRVKQVVFVEICSRFAGKYPCSPSFNLEARQYNEALRRQVSTDRRIHVHHHHGMVDNWEQYLSDGVHFNQAGMTKYAKSLRRAILRYSSRHLIDAG